MDIPKMNISVAKAAVNGQVFDVVTREELNKNLENYSNNSYAVRSTKNNDVILPIKGEYTPNTTIPGVYLIGNVATVEIMPEEAFINRYIPDNYIEMNNAEDIRDLIKKGDAMKRLDEPFLTSPDNITKIPIKENDQPEMRALKMALNAKNIDIDKYAGRFGENYPNDKRQLKNNNATLKIIKRFCENCDMDAILIFKDKNPDVPNPMNSEIAVSLVDPNLDIDEYNRTLTMDNSFESDDEEE